MPLSFVANAVSIGGNLSSQSFNIVDTEGETTLDVQILQSDVEVLKDQMIHEIQDRIRGDELNSYNLTVETENRAWAILNLTEQLQYEKNALNGAISDLNTAFFTELTGTNNTVINIRNDLEQEIITRHTQIQSLESSLSTERDTRGQQIWDLQQNLGAEIDTRTNLINSLQNDIQTETSLRTDAITTVQSNLLQAIEDRLSQDNIHTAAIEALRNSLLQAIIEQGNSNTEITNLQASLLEAIQERLTQDLEHSNSISTLQTEVAQQAENQMFLNSRLDDEIRSRDTIDITQNSRLIFLEDRMDLVEGGGSFLLDTKFDKTGGIINGNVIVQGGYIAAGNPENIYSAFNSTGNIQLSDGQNVMTISPTRIQVSGPNSNTSLNITPSLAVFNVVNTDKISLKEEYSSMEVPALTIGGQPVVPLSRGQGKYFPLNQTNANGFHTVSFNSSENSNIESVNYDNSSQTFTIDAISHPGLYLFYCNIQWAGSSGTQNDARRESWFEIDEGSGIVKHAFTALANASSYGQHMNASLYLTSVTTVKVRLYCSPMMSYYGLDNGIGSTLQFRISKIG